MISIIVVSYNEYQYIAETLESIKYQIEKFGHNVEFQLIVADDASSDNTQEIVSKWVANNRTLFADIKLLFRKENVGIVKNLADAIKNADGKVLTVAGDDLLADTDIVSKVLECNGKKIVFCHNVSFCNKNIILNWKSTFEKWCIKFHSNEFIARNSRYFNNFPVGSIISTDIYTDGLYTFWDSFTYLEDLTRWYYLFSKEESVEVSFDNSITCLYRRHEKQISGKGARVNATLAKDYDVLTQIARGKTNNVVERFHIWCTKFTLISPRFYKLTKLIDPMYFSRYFILPTNYFEAYRDIKGLLNKQRIIKLEEYLNIIYNNARMYYNLDE